MNEAFNGKRTGIRVAVCAALALLWVAFAALATHERGDVWQLAYLNASNTGRIVALDLKRNLDVLKLSLQGLSQGLSFPGLEHLPRKERDQILYDRAASAEFFANLFVTDEHGDLAVDSGGLTPRRVNYADREYFRVLRDHPTLEMYVNRPVYSKVGDGWTMPVARGLSHADGSFAGVAVGGLRLGYILHLFRQANLGRDATISLVRTDGTLAARWPPKDETIGGAVEYPSDEGTEGGTTGRSSFDGIDRYWVRSEVGKYPLAVVVGLSTSDLLSSWNWRIFAIGLSLLVLSVIIAALIFRLAGELGWRVRSEASLARQNLELEKGRQQFDAALDNMTQGLTFFDAEQRLLVCNRRYREIYHLSSDQTRSGATLEDILSHRMASGSFPNMTTADYLGRREALSRSSIPYDVTDELRDGRTISMHHQPLPNGGWVATHEDITERRRAEANLAFMAQHDALTLLPNRVLFYERLSQAIETTGRGLMCAVLCLDLDHFKLVNDTLGHPIGDRLLQAAADRLQACVREVDTVARLGGDEFAIIQLGVERAEDAALLANRIIHAFRKEFEIEGHQINVGTSIGIALPPGDGTLPERLLKNADIALYLAKTEGRGTARFFEPEMDARIQLRRMLELDLRGAVLRNEFEVLYQPTVELEQRRVSGFETLLRWHHPARGLIEPVEFIRLAEETGLIVSIGEWVMRTACFDAAGWADDIRVAVNLSPGQFKRGDLVATVMSALEDSGLPPNRLELEITESVVLQTGESTLDTLHQLRAMGISIALDDFGTGFSSLSYLRSFSFDRIKIDQSFVCDLVDNQDSLSIVRAIVGLGKSLRMQTTAEGVETAEQLQILREEGCFEVQGYLFSHPKPASALRAMMEKLKGEFEPA